MARVDLQVGRLIEAYKQAGLFDRTLWVVVSDHGMTPNSVNIKPSLIDLVLSEGRYRLVGGHTTEYWLKDVDENAEVARAIDAARVDGLVGAYFKVDQGSGHFVFEPSPAVAATLSSRTRAALEWLYDTFACPQAPDVATVLEENAHFNNKPINTIGAHSEVTWLLQRIPIIFSGPGVRPGFVSPYPARLIDVAPTILSLMGLPAERMDGVPIQDVLAGSTAAARDLQFSLPETRRMLRHQETLSELATLDS